MTLITAAAGAIATPTVGTGGHATGMQTEPKLEAATSVDVIFLKTGQFLLLYSLQLWQHLQCCCQTRASVPLFFDAFYFHSTETVCRERYISEGSERIQVSTCVKKLAAAVRFLTRALACKRSLP